MRRLIRADRTTVAIAAAMVLTFVMALIVGTTTKYRASFDDEIVYRLLAHNLLRHHFFGYTNTKFLAYRAPGFPFFDAAIRWIDDSAAVVRGVQAVLAAATVGVASMITRRLFGDLAAVACAFVLLAIGTLSVYATFELSETLSTATLVAMCAVMLIAIDSARVRDLVIAGVLGGISILARPQTLFLIVPLALLVAAAWRGARSASLRAGALLACVMLATLAPWTIRNAVRLQEFVPVSDYGGVNLYLANNPKADGDFTRANAVIGDARYIAIARLPEAQQDRTWYRMAFSYIAAHPFASLHHWVRDGILFLRRPDDLLQRYDLVTRSMHLPRLDDRWLWVPAFFGGIIALRRRDPARALVPAVVVVYFVAFFMVFLPLPRFRHGIVPFLAVYTGAAIAWLIARLQHRLQNR